ncbi:MAG: outer membrane lipoprotein carrier protein LolA [Bacteroidetes bacterium]|nr:outer membrane lipoprotein carrier protein LolA [Bacteroidota bacterium]MBS1972890.1 outer membrane lipoprotein carrier protein LolA [Bacteroidota bacterium]
MRKPILLLLLIACASVQSQPPGYSPVADMIKFKQEFSAASQKMQSMKSDFVQEKNLAMLSEKIISKGKFWFKKDNMVRMEYSTPFQYLMIMNRNNVYLKDGSKESKVSASSNKLFQQINKITVDCVRGTALANTDFKFTIFENGKNYLVALSPIAKNLKGYFRNIDIYIDKKDYSVSKIDMIELSGDDTIIHFANKELNADIPDALFAIH